MSNFEHDAAIALIVIVPVVVVILSVVVYYMVKLRKAIRGILLTVKTLQRAQSKQDRKIQQIRDPEANAELYPVDIAENAEDGDDEDSDNNQVASENKSFAINAGGGDRYLVRAPLGGDNKQESEDDNDDDEEKDNKADIPNAIPSDDDEEDV